MPRPMLSQSTCPSTRTQNIRSFQKSSSVAAPDVYLARNAVISFSLSYEMGRSSGARPHAKNKERVETLRAKLGTIRSDEWQKAQAVFDEMCALCEVHGPSGGMMVPRSCRVCKFFGHTQQFCPVKKARDAARTEREIERDRAHGYVPPSCVEECPGGQEQWEMICRQDEIERIQEEKTALGMGCHVDRGWITCASDKVMPSECGCQGCKEWLAWTK